MKSLCVFCGSKDGTSPLFMQSARDLGKRMAESEIRLVYGGAAIGLMGAVADSVLLNGGQVVGVLPRFLADMEIAHPGLTELIICESLHERKMKMFQHSDGFLALPGGFGTLEEVIEVLTWKQLNLHAFPVAFLNVNGFYEPLRAMFEEMHASGFLRIPKSVWPAFVTSPEEALSVLRRG